MNLQESKIHFIGIGGIGMSGIAEVLVNMGCAVSGSDQAVNAQVERLQSIGAQIARGHKPSNIPTDCHAVVYSSAVLATNPEIQEAKKRKIPIIQRAEMLAELMRLKRGIAIGGTHGKTTTTSMVATVMTHGKLDPTIVVGGRLDLIKSSAALGQGQWLLAEADESDGSFLKLSPEIAVITNIDNDHLENYKGFEDLKQSFAQFAGKVPFYGSAVFCVDDPHVEKIYKNFSKRKVGYGFSKNADLRVENLQVSSTGQIYDVTSKGKTLGQINLRVPGRHNVLNSLAAVAVSLELGIPFSKIAEGLKNYNGVDRRIQKIGEIKHVQIYDDYGHHPTEVLATLSAMRELFPDNRIVVAFQPHRYSRTKTCWKQFLFSFKKADIVGFMDIYSAGEKKIAGIHSKALALATARASKKKNTFYWGSKDKTIKELFGLLQEGDVLLTLGAGNVNQIGKEILKAWD